MRKFTIFMIALLPVLLAACDNAADSGRAGVSTVKLDRPTLNFPVGDTETLTASVFPEDAYNAAVSWASSNPAVATVEEGVVTAIKAGTAQIVASAGGQIDVCMVTVPASQVSVTGISLDRTEFIIGPGDRLTLTPTVLPANASNKHVAWRSSNPALANVVGGEVLGLAKGSVTIRAITEDGDFEAACQITVNWMGMTSFRSDETWTVGANTWSDVVRASGCRKVDYNGGDMNDIQSLAPDCCENGTYGDLFSWTAVDLHGSQLCPEPWRVPTAEEFITLDKALGGTGKYDSNNSILRDRYLDEWGAEYGGYVYKIESTLWKAGQETIWYYWSQTPAGDKAVSLFGNASNEVLATASNSKAMGSTVRCIK